MGANRRRMMHKDHADTVHVHTYVCVRALTDRFASVLHCIVLYYCAVCVYELIMCLQ
jgi:hypothetical protein